MQDTANVASGELCNKAESEYTTNLVYRLQDTVHSTLQIKHYSQLFVYMLFFYYLCPRFWSLEINYALHPASCISARPVASAFCRALPVLYLRVHVLRFLRLPSIWTPDSGNRTPYLPPFKEGSVWGSASNFSYPPNSSYSSNLSNWPH